MRAWFGAIAQVAVLGLAGLAVVQRPDGQGALRFEIRDAATGELVPCRLTLVGVGNTRDPRLTRRASGERVGDAVVVENRILSLTGTGAVRVPRGRYHVVVSRGPEWDVTIARDVRVGRRGAEMRARLAHVVDTTGWLSADLHVHSAASSDSSVPLEHRVVEFVAEGVDLIAATDHNRVADYGPVIAALGAGRHLASVRGDEITTWGRGHFGAFALPEALAGTRYGAEMKRSWPVPRIFDHVRGHAPDAVVSVFHPRSGRRTGYFDAYAHPPAGYDAIEVMNGFKDPDRRQLERVLLDWFELLDAGAPVGALGNSDTHRLTDVLAGYPRNYLRCWPRPGSPWTA